MGTQGKERLFSEDKPLKAPLAWHEIIRSEKEKDEFLSSQDIFVSKVEELEENLVQQRYISVLEGEFAGISPGLYIESNIPPELSNNPNLTRDIVFEIASLLAKQGESKITGELPPELAALVPELSGKQLDIDFGNSFELKVSYTADDGGTVFEITPQLHSRAVNNAIEIIEGKVDGFIVLES
jgi:hypothetical protein